MPLSLILKRWLCDCAMPSSLEQEFPWLGTGELARYYEEGRGVEGEFILSWDFVERFYREAANLPQSSAILKMIAEMRGRGYDHTLRAGQSMYTFIVARSRRQGLKANQPLIAFEFRKDGMDLRAKFGDEKKLSYAQQAQLFQSEQPLTRLRVKGHGLGLSIVRQIMRKIDGHVAVESEVGRGSTFSFSLLKTRLA